MRARVVIGAGFGDESKGKLVDYYVRRDNAKAVVRFNGGAQAGHTVVAPDGKQHVFGHFGSGSLAGAATVLSEQYIVNPMLFRAESAKLGLLGVTPKVVVDVRAPVTTPYDMLMNEAIENYRGALRHGSVGVGINETLKRSLFRDFALNAGGARRFDSTTLRELLTHIRQEWIPQRLTALGYSKAILVDVARLVTSEAVVDNWLDDLAYFNENTIPTGGTWPLDHDLTPFVLEGAQGLLLDRNCKQFDPHLTPTDTGLTNPELMPGITDLDVTYVTRAYLTRHGAGKLPGELPEAPYRGITDETNRPNSYQGTIRYAHLDLDLLERTLRRDLAKSSKVRSVTIAVTCLDQVGAHVHWWRNHELRAGSPESLLEAIWALGIADELLVSDTPCSDSVRPYYEPAYAVADRNLALFLEKHIDV